MVYLLWKPVVGFTGNIPLSVVTVWTGGPGLRNGCCPPAVCWRMTPSAGDSMTVVDAGMLDGSADFLVSSVNWTVGAAVWSLKSVAVFEVRVVVFLVDF